MNTIDTHPHSHHPRIEPAGDPVSGPGADPVLDPGQRRRVSPFAWATIGAIRLYQLVRMGRVSPCRFTPTCSEFAVEAVERPGTRRGLALTARRLGRCRPGGPSGYDPVPE
jgi:putative membrane protein insertion efficiency factor